MKDKTPREALWGLIKDTRFCMLVHRHADGSLHSHPMTTQNKELGEDDSIYFFMSRKTEVGQRLRQDGNVNLAYADVDADSWVSVTGQATIVEDMAKKKELFNAMVKAWFPGGVEDPDLELVAVRILQAEYWDVKSSKLVQLLKMGKAALTDKPPTDMTEHREVQF